MKPRMYPLFRPKPLRVRSDLLPVLLSVLLLVAACQDGDGAPSPSETPEKQASPTLTATIRVSVAETPTRTPTEQPTLPPPSPTATAESDRTTCEDIAGTPYRSESERRWYLANCITPTPTIPLQVTTTPPATQAPAPQSNIRHLFRLVNSVMVPDLAEAWEFREGNSVIAFKLAANVTLADGRVMDSGAVKQILDAHRPQLVAAGYGDTTVMDARTIFVTLNPARLDTLLEALAAVEIPVDG